MIRSVACALLAIILPYLSTPAWAMMMGEKRIVASAHDYGNDLDVTESFQIGTGQDLLLYCSNFSLHVPLPGACNDYVRLESTHPPLQASPHLPAFSSDSAGSSVKLCGVLTPFFVLFPGDFEVRFVTDGTGTAYGYDCSLVQMQTDA